MQARAFFFVLFWAALCSAAAFRGPDFVEVSPSHLDALLDRREEDQVLHDSTGRPVVVRFGAHPRIHTAPTPDGVGTRVCVAPEALAEDWSSAAASSGDAVSNGGTLADEALEHLPDTAAAVASVEALDQRPESESMRARLDTLGFARPRFARGTLLDGPSARAVMMSIESEWGVAEEPCGREAIAGDADRHGYYEFCPGRHFRWFIERNRSDVTGGGLPDTVDEQTVFGRYHADLSRPVVAGDHLIATYPDGDACPADPKLHNLRYETTVTFRCLDDAAASATRQRRWELHELAGHCRAVVSIYTTAVCAFLRAGGASHDVPVVPCAVLRDFDDGTSD